MGVACSILSNPKVVDKSPFNVISELLILADKNKITGLSGAKSVTTNTIAQVA